MPRPFVRVSNRIEDDPDLDGLSVANKVATTGAFVFALGYCDRERTDGKISASRFRKIGTAEARRILLRIGWVEPDGDGYRIPGYLQWQQSRADIERLSAAGRAGAAARYGSHTNRNADRIPAEPANRNANRNADRIATDTETETSTPPVVGLASDRAGAREAGNDDDLVTAVQTIMFTATGRSVRPDVAERIAAAILGDRADIRDPVAFVRAAIQRDPSRARALAERSQPVGERASDRPAAARSLCRRCGGNHPTGECPTLADGEPGPRPVPNWRARGSYPPPEVAERGANAARAALAEAMANRRAGLADRLPEPDASSKSRRDDAKQRDPPNSDPPDDNEQPPF